MIVKCSNCKRVLIKDGKPVHLTFIYDFEVSERLTSELGKKAICDVCGRVIPYEKVKDLIEE